MPIDAYRGYQRSITAPASDAFAISPSDAADLVKTVRAIYVGGSGDVTLIPPDGSGTVTFRALNAGTVLPVGAVRVAATGTTASNLVGLV